MKKGGISYAVSSMGSMVMFGLNGTKRKYIRYGRLLTLCYKIFQSLLKNTMKIFSRFRQPGTDYLR